MIDSKYITHRREPFFQIALDYIEPESTVLDIGAGDGFFSKFCGRNDFCLYDGNLRTVEELRSKFPNVIFGRLPDLPFENQSFDLIHSSHVIEHLEPRELYESLVQMDRVLKTGGYLVVSTPLIWDGFYNDLSHVRPYTPRIFEKYLCGDVSTNGTRDIISNSYEIVKTVYRYNSVENFVLFNHSRNSFLTRFIHSLLYRSFAKGLEVLQRSGYTIVLRKK